MFTPPRYLEQRLHVPSRPSVFQPSRVPQPGRQLRGGEPVCLLQLLPSRLAGGNDGAQGPRQEGHLGPEQSRT